MKNGIIKTIITAVLTISLLMTPVITARADTKNSEPPAATEKEPANPWAGTISSFNVESSGESKGKTVGLYIIQSFNKIYVDGTLEQISKNSGLTSNEIFFPVGYEIDEKGSPLAFNCIHATAEALGGTFLGALNLNSAKMVDGKLIPLDEDTVIPFTFGVDNPDGKKLVVIKIESDGIVTVLDDMDEDTDTVTVPVSGGLSAYAIIAI